jgi:alanine dehydrogenase
MPGAVARTSTQALENSTLPFTLQIAGKGYKKALIENIHLMNGLNVIDSKIVHREVAKSLGYHFFDPIDSL